jgi:hypothetical protein
MKIPKSYSSVKSAKEQKYKESLDGAEYVLGTIASVFYFSNFLLFWGVGLVFELRVHTCKPGTLLLEPHLQHI